MYPEGQVKGPSPAGLGDAGPRSEAQDSLSWSGRDPSAPACPWEYCTHCAARRGGSWQGSVALVLICLSPASLGGT